MNGIADWTWSEWYLHVSFSLREICPGLPRLCATCPDCAQGPYRGELVVIHLNDYHHWTREKIADWLDTLDVDLTLAGPRS